MTPAADADYANLQRTIAELQVENERLKADRQMWDWVELQKPTISFADRCLEEDCPGGPHICVYAKASTTHFYDATFRGVISRAMNAFPKVLR